MRLVYLFRAFLLSLAVLPCGLQAADVYVSTAGSNAWPGTIDFPVRSIDFAADRVNPGDTIFVRAGEYRERLTPNRSGNAANRITIRNFPGETPIIDGTGQSVGGQTAMQALKPNASPLSAAMRRAKLPPRENPARYIRA